MVWVDLAGGSLAWEEGVSFVGGGWWGFALHGSRRWMRGVCWVN